MQKHIAARFDLAHVGLTEAQLKTIAGARPPQKTTSMTSPVVVTCYACWA